MIAHSRTLVKCDDGPDPALTSRPGFLQFSPTSHSAPLPPGRTGQTSTGPRRCRSLAVGRVVFARANLAAPVCSGQLGGRRQCFRFAVLAWRRVGAGLGQFLAEHYDLRRSVDPQADAAVLVDCTTVTRMDSLMRMLSPTFRERTSMIDPSMMSLAATGPSMTLVGSNCRLPVGLFPCCFGNIAILPRRGHPAVSG